MKRKQTLKKKILRKLKIGKHGISGEINKGVQYIDKAIGKVFPSSVKKGSKMYSTKEGHFLEQKLTKGEKKLIKAIS